MRQHLSGVAIQNWALSKLRLSLKCDYLLKNFSENEVATFDKFGGMKHCRIVGTTSLLLLEIST